MTPWTAAHQASRSFTVSQSLLKPMSIELMMPSNLLILCHPLLLPSIFPSIRVFFSESALRIRWSKYWSFSISPSNEYSGLISFRIDCFDILAVQGTQEFSLAPQSETVSTVNFRKFSSPEKESLLPLVLTPILLHFLPSSVVRHC